MSRNNQISVLPGNAVSPIGAPHESGQRAFKIDEIPLLLFEELSERLGVDRETTVTVGEFMHRMRKLNSEYPALGFECWISYHVHYDNQHTLSIWNSIPSSHPDDFQIPTAQIIAGPIQSGTWCAGSGNKMISVIRMEYGSTGTIWLRREEIPFLALLMLRASEISRRPECISETFWDGRGKF